jgi:glucokinase
MSASMLMPKRLTLGIDLGGTGIKLGIVDPNGTLLETLKISTPVKSDPVLVAAAIVAQARLLLATVPKRAIGGIGVGTAGDVDPHTGVVRISPNLNWKNVPLKSLLQKELRYPITIDNDANAAAWATYVVEARRKVKNLLCVTVGTGVGGGVILNGELYRGTTGSAAEIGHITLYPDGEPCACGNRGCLERYVGARAMQRIAREALQAGEKSIIPQLVNNDLANITPLILTEAAKLNDPLAKKLWDQVGERLGIGLASLINVLNPEWIVLAGGLSRAGGLLLHPTRETIRQRAFPTPAAAAKLVVSKLDQDLGMVGAGLIAH